MLIGLGIAIAWAMAGPWSRTSRGPSLAREVLLAALMAAPFAALFCAAWLLVTRGEDALAVAQLQVVPASVAVCGSVCVAAFLAALAWRLLRGHGVSEEKTEETGEERAEAQAY